MNRLLAPTMAGFLVLTASACSSSSLDLGARTWSGTWRGTSQGASDGTLTLEFSGSDEFGPIDTFDVDVTIHGPACASPEGVHGAGREAAAELPPAVSFAVQIGSSVYRFEGTRSYDTMSGTYVRVSGSCSECVCGLGDSGTWQVSA